MHYILVILLFCSLTDLHAETHLLTSIAPALVGENPARPSGVANTQRRYNEPGARMLEDYAAAWNGEFKNKRYNINSQFREASDMVRASEEEARKTFIREQREWLETWKNSEGLGGKKGFTPKGYHWTSKEALEEGRIATLKKHPLFNELDATFNGALSARLKNTENRRELIASINALRNSDTKEEFEKNLKSTFEGLNAAGISPRLVFGPDGNSMGHPFSVTSQWQSIYWKTLKDYDKKSIGA